MRRNCLKWRLAHPDTRIMFWRKNKPKNEPTPGDPAEYEDKWQSRIRDIGQMETGYTDEDAAEVEARLRNMNYGTNRE